jgi:HK97 family phage major capsid protein
MSRVEELQTKAAEAAKNAREIAEKADADGIPLTGGALAKYQDHMAKARHYLDAFKTAKADQEIEAQARALAAEIGDPVKGGTKTTRRTWAKETAARMAKAMAMEVDGQKSLISGSVGVPAPIETDVITMTDAPRTLLELIPAKGLGGGFGTGNTFSYLKQTVRTHNAAPVPDGALKPTSVYTLAEVEDRVRVIAHLSEKVPVRFFDDHANLEQFLQNQMEAGLFQELEHQVLSGDGTGENFTGLLNTSGIVVQAFATDALTSVRKGLTSLQVSGITPTALVLHPEDAEAFDLLRESGSSGGFLLGDPSGKGASSLWSIPRVPSVAVPVGTAILGDWQQAEIVVREDATLAVDRSGDNFTHNLVQLRLEGRFGFAVKRPSAFVEVALAA